MPARSLEPCVRTGHFAPPCTAYDSPALYDMLRLHSHRALTVVLTGIMAFGRNKKLTMPRPKKSKVEQPEQLSEARGRRSAVAMHAVVDSEACVEAEKHVVVDSPEKEKRLMVKRVKRKYEAGWKHAVHWCAQEVKQSESQIEDANRRASALHARYGQKRPELAFEKICEQESVVKDALLHAQVAKYIAMEQYVKLLLCENDELKLEIAKLKRSRRK